MKRKENGTYCPPDYIHQEIVQGALRGRWWLEANRILGLTGLGIHGSDNFTRIAKKMRNNFEDLLTHHKEK